LRKEWPGTREFAVTAGAFDLSSIADGLYIGWYRRKWIPNLSISMFLLGASAVVIALAVRASFGSGFGGTSESDLVLASFFCALGALIL